MSGGLKDEVIANQGIQVGKSKSVIMVKKLLGYRGKYKFKYPPQKNNYPMRSYVSGVKQDEEWRTWCAVSK